jgi:hypothetical protein
MAARMRGLGLGVRVRLCDCGSGTLVCVMPSGHLTAKPGPGIQASPGPSRSTEIQPKPDAQITPCRRPPFHLAAALPVSATPTAGRRLAFDLIVAMVTL